MRQLFGLLVVTALLSTACGGDDAVGGAAEIVPADVAVFVSADTDFDGDQWQTAEELVRKFPDGPRALQQLLSELEEDENVSFEQDVKPALGPEVAVVVLEIPEGDGEPPFVVLTQPEDEGKLRELLTRSEDPVVIDQVAGWTIVSDSQASIDAFKSARGDGTLAGSEDYREATEGLDEEALGRVYVSGQALQEVAEREPDYSAGTLKAMLPGGQFPSFALVLQARDDGVRLDGNARFAGELVEGGFASAPYEAKLPETVPAGVLFYLSFSDLEGQLSKLRDAFAGLEPDVERQLGQVEAMLGVSLEEDVAPLFANEGAFYVRRGALIPEVTLLLEVDDEARALETVDKLVEGLGRFAPVGTPRPVEIAGVQARELVLQDAPVALVYAAFDGKLVLTTSREGIAALREDGDRLAGEDAFEEAKERADVPEETSGFGYVNLQEIISLALGLGEAVAGAETPSELRPNLEPLRQLVFYQTAEGDRATFSAFLGID